MRTRGWVIKWTGVYHPGSYLVSLKRMTAAVWADNPKKARVFLTRFLAFAAAKAWGEKGPATVFRRTSRRTVG